MSRELLTTAQQDRITATVTDYLPTEVPITVLRQRSPQTPNGSGGFVEEWDIVASGLPALITPYAGRSGGGEFVRDSRFEQPTVWKISLPALTDVLTADRLQAPGREWEVKSVVGPESLEVIREVFCVERLSG